MDPSPAGRPWQLNDREWLARRYAQDGDMAIALDLHVSRGSVIRARERLDIPSLPPGRRRGKTNGVRADEPRPGGRTLTGSISLIADRFEAENVAGGPAPTETLLVARLRAAHEAKRAGDSLAYEDALIAIASAAGLVHQHQRRLRSAA